jgi:hypothetical protein
MLKKALKITAIVLTVLLIAAFALPYLFKDKITLKLKETINSKLNAKVNFKEVDISLFRHFPKMAVALEDFQIIGTGDFVADTLIFAKNIDVTLNLMSVIGGEMQVYGVTINEPRIHAIVNAAGKVNWDILKPDSTALDTAESKPFSLKLKHYEIKEGYLSYIDKQGNMGAQVLNLNHSGSGDFINELFTLQTSTEAAAVTYTYNNIPFLYKVKTAIEADIQVNNKTNTYTFKTGDILLNSLKLFAEGNFQLLDSAYAMDIKFNAPSSEFKHVLSLVPAMFTKDFDKLEADGKTAFSGFVKGTYSDQSIPAYAIKLDVENGSFQYSDLPKPVKNIQLKLDVNNPDGITDHTVVNIQKGHLEMDNTPFDFRLLIKNPVSNLYIDAAAKGKMNLANVRQFAKLDESTRLSGLLDADVNLKGNVSAIERQEFNRFQAAGTIRLSGMNYVTKDYPGGINVQSLLMTFNPKNVVVSDFKGQYLKTNFLANGAINNLLGYLLKNQALQGNLNVKADRLHLNDWMAGAETKPTDTAVVPFAVPSRIDFKLNASAKEVNYDKLAIQNLSGSLRLKDETLTMSNVKGEALDGTLLINGSYSTKLSKKNPDIALNYEVKDMNVQKTFNAFNTVQKLMPIGQFISGKFSSQLSLNGKLGENMMPQMNSLSGDGKILLIQGVLTNFEPLNKLASTLNVSQLKNINLKNISNHIVFNNGRVQVKPFKLKVDEIDMEIGGAHGFDQSLDYNINMKLPRSMMGSGANTFVNNLAAKASAGGVPVRMSDVINLSVKMGGNIKNPSLKTDLKQSSTSLASEAKTQVTNAAKDTLKSVKDQAVNKAKEEVKRIIAKDTTTKKVLKNVLDGFLKKKDH